MLMHLAAWIGAISVGRVSACKSAVNGGEKPGSSLTLGWHSRNVLTQRTADVGRALGVHQQRPAPAAHDLSLPPCERCTTSFIQLRDYILLEGRSRCMSMDLREDSTGLISS